MIRQLEAIETTKELSPPLTEAMVPQIESLTDAATNVPNLPATEQTSKFDRSTVTAEPNIEHTQMGANTSPLTDGNGRGRKYKQSKLSFEVKSDFDQLHMSLNVENMNFDPGPGSKEP